MIIETTGVALLIILLALGIKKITKDDRFIYLSYILLIISAYFINVITDYIYFEYQFMKLDRITMIGNITAIIITGYVIILMLWDIWRWVDDRHKNNNKQGNV